LNPCAQGKIFCIILATSLHARGRPVGYDAASDIISGDAGKSQEWAANIESIGLQLRFRGGDQREDFEA